MGGACCVAARNKSIIHETDGEILNRNHHYSPTWSFRWDNNRGRVAGEDTSIHWFSDRISGNDGSQSDLKFDSGQDGSQSGSFQRCMWHKSPVSDATAARLQTPASDLSISRNISMETSLERLEAKDSADSPEPSTSSSHKLAIPLSSTSSFSTFQLSPQRVVPPVEALQCLNDFPRNQLTYRTTDGIPGLKSSNSLSTTDERLAMPSCSNYLTRGYHDGSSNGSPMRAFPVPAVSSPKDSLSLDDEGLNSLLLDDEGLTFQQEKTTNYGRSQVSPPVNIPTCGVCLKALTERSLWSTRKLVINNELSVVAVLICGHVYHAECLEILTPEMDKYDPACPICTFGEKQTLKLSQKALKAKIAAKAKSKKSRKRIVDSDLDSDSYVFDHLKTQGYDGKSPKTVASSSKKGPKMASSSSMKTSKPFLRHFSFGSKGSKSFVENNMTRKGGFFWSKSMKA